MRIRLTDQAETGYYWEKLTAGGQESKCGWLYDKFDVPWQVVPQTLGSLKNNAAAAPKKCYACIKMKKLNIVVLEQAIKK
jgi:predicted 3-demethylubiquinone-9 3-methyltransferase (glyoxalase superfamily)